MKRDRKGDLVLMGQINGNTKKRFQLFDGKFTTGYRVVDFKIQDHASTGSYEQSALLSTTEKAVTLFWDWADIEQIGWAGFQAPNKETQASEILMIRPGNMIIQDLYLSIYSTMDNRFINYYIELEKYTFEAYDGATYMIRNTSQG